MHYINLNNHTMLDVSDFHCILKHFAKTELLYDRVRVQPHLLIPALEPFKHKSCLPFCGVSVI